MEEIGISATLIRFRGELKKIVLIRQIGNGKWLVRFRKTDRETEVFENEFVLD
jgi:hypothetical protein